MGRLLGLGLVALSGCTAPEAPQTLQGQAQGTTYSVQYWSEGGADSAGLAAAVSAELARIDAGMSGYRGDSTVEIFNVEQLTTPQWVGTEIVGLVEDARAVSLASGGCYDLTIKPLFDLWGFSDDRFAVPSAQAVEQALLGVGMDKLIREDEAHLRKAVPDLKVDLSSIAQGYSVARIAEVLEHRNIHNYLVEIGGELLVRGTKPDNQPWRIAIETPLPGERRIEKVIVVDAGTSLAVMTSGTYRHFYDSEGVRYSHILNAQTGYPVRHETRSVTVLYPDAALADAWSTALLCLGAEAGLPVADRQGIPAVFIEQRGDQLSEVYSEALQRLSSVHFESPQGTSEPPEAAGKYDEQRKDFQSAE